MDIQKYLEKLSLLATSSEALISAVLPEINKIIKENNHNSYVIKELIIGQVNTNNIHIFCSKCSFFLDIEYSARQISPQINFDLLKVKCDSV